jgi:hypothetical protein
MQPHPASDVKPAWSTNWLLSLTENVIAATAFGSWDFGMSGKFDRYVNHILDSKSSRNEGGHPSSLSDPPVDSL